MSLLARTPGVRRLPQVLGPVRRDVVLFDSWRGQFSDNPRAIAEELHRRDTGLDLVWVLDPSLAGEVPGWVTPVATGSAAHLRMLGRARVLVANSTVYGYFHKRAGTTFLQTWHGTPLKRIGVHVRRDGSRSARQAVRTLAHNVPRWDVLLSPNHFSTPIFREAFGYEGEVLEAGYPRNDLLVGPAAEEIRDRTRRRLGVDGRRVVLYAPTFREPGTFARAGDAQQLAEVLGRGGNVVLLRAHKIDAPQIGPGDAAFIDVSRYPDNRELYLAADVLVTDYSSLMFDFAVTGKPMLFLTPDLREYRDEGRGFYFDFEREAPGPLCATVDDVVAALADLDAVAARSRPAYDRFVERFCHLDDGRASARVVDDLLARAG